MELELDKGKGNNGQRSGLLKQQGCRTATSYTCMDFLSFGFLKIIFLNYLLRSA